MFDKHQLNHVSYGASMTAVVVVAVVAADAPVGMERLAGRRMLDNATC
jgi:hypothetical protein